MRTRILNLVRSHGGFACLIQAGELVDTSFSTDPEARGRRGCPVMGFVIPGLLSSPASRRPHPSEASQGPETRLSTSEVSLLGYHLDSLYYLSRCFRLHIVLRQSNSSHFV